VIPAIGEKVAGDRESYQYLVESIRAFPKQKTLVKRMEDVGFKVCQYKDLSFGLVAIHQGIKI